MRWHCVAVKPQEVNETILQIEFASASVVFHHIIQELHSVLVVFLLAAK